ncbi:MAG: succinate dehydrogenase, cytochrome b556 subunit [Betaproteobacteria bacterium]|nr:succinate dehydrogenase, cytochrome b556 subunit [Betaproteobacteria bacterium]
MVSTVPRKRIFYLNLLQIWLPIGAYVSILHRASGVLLGLSIPGLLWVWSVSLGSAEGFASVQAMLRGGPGLLLGCVLLWAFLHHLLAGLRHLGFDLGWGESRLAARRSAWLTLLLSVVILLGLTLS